MSTESTEVEWQRRYYAETADDYDQMHVAEKDDHIFALSILTGMLDFLEIESVLDVGAGTGRVNLFLKKQRPALRVLGVEPVAALRQVGHRRGVSESDLIDGDATALRFGPGEFDLACEFGVLHHLRRPDQAISEMLRVARKAIFVSDCNNFGQGSAISKAIKQTLCGLGVWRAVNYVKTGGKGYAISGGDGLAYSYSVFNDHRLIRSRCRSVHVINMSGAGVNHYRSAGHVALLGIKK
jgi:ubiquinone/menaquinone biosynthesis C-methylase UbiE